MFSDKNEIYLRKKEQRKTIAARRRELTREECAEKSRAICRHLETLLERGNFQDVRTVFSYRAMPEEANVDRFNRRMEECGRKVAYPVSLPHGIMKAAVPQGDDAWCRGAYGITEPDLDRSEILLPEQMDLILVPCVAFDRKGNRCGHGAGYYDRFLALCRPETILIMAAFDMQELEEIATEETDRRIPRLVTESGYLQLTGPEGFRMSGAG